jgi:hypothetical protein
MNDIFKMKKIFILLLQFIALYIVQAQKISINDIVGDYSYPSIAEGEKNVFFVHSGKAFYYNKPHVNTHISGRDGIPGHALIDITYNEKVGRYELSDSIIRVFRDTLSSDILYEFKIFDSLNLEVLFSSDTSVNKRAFFHRRSSYFEFEDQEYPFMTPCPWMISRYGNRKSEDEEYICEYRSERGKQPVWGYYYQVDGSKILPKSIYRSNTSMLVNE